MYYTYTLWTFTWTHALVHTLCWFWVSLPCVTKFSKAHLHESTWAAIKEGNFYFHTFFWLDSHLFCRSDFKQNKVECVFLSTQLLLQVGSWVVPWIRMMFKLKSPWLWLRNVANLHDPRTRQAPPKTSLTSNTWKDASVDFVVNPGTTQEPAHGSNWADKRAHSNLLCLKSDRQKRCESSQKKGVKIKFS